MPLHVLATPIGNLGDLSPRAREILGRADLVLCEDTRVTRRLLSALGLRCPELWRCDAERERDCISGVLDRLEAGAEVVLVSDAGTPALSDPGTAVVAAAHEAGVPVRSVPGPSACAAAISVSGLPATPFHFLGFPPRKKGALLRWLRDASGLPGMLVCFESGRRLDGLLQVLAEHMGDRRVTVCRELSKLYEEVTLAHASDHPLEPVPGEVVVVVGPGDPIPDAVTPANLEGLKDLARVVATRTGCSRSEAYRELVAMEERLSSSGEP